MVTLLIPICFLAGGVEAQVLPRVDPPFVGTPHAVVDLMLDVGDVGSDDVVFDLGSGDGRLVLAAARRGARSVGVEYDLGLVSSSREAARRDRLEDRARFVHADIFETDVREATVVLLYLSPEFNLRLRPTLLAELEPGARVVSHAFHMGEWRPDTTVTIGAGAERATVFGWTVPALIDGFWLLEIRGEGSRTLEIVQSFQDVSGAARAGAEVLPIRQGQVRGEDVEISFAGPGAGLTLRGSLIDGQLVGTASMPGAAPVPFRASRFGDPRRAGADASVGMPSTPPIRSGS
jgi:SAM-dependent methyltransferase